MDEAIYKCHIVHDRILPKKYKFGFNFFWYSFDLDQLELLDKKSIFFSYNRFNLFSFWDNNHLKRNNFSTKKNVQLILAENGVYQEPKKVQILTNLSFMGYVFNPVTYYFILMDNGEQHCIIEVCNTYKEIKPYFVSSKNLKGNTFKITTNKEFYISPFSDLDNIMTFNISLPTQRLKVSISDYKKNQDLELRTALTGEMLSFNNSNLLRAAVLKPFATLQIIISIHWHALKLFLKRIPYFQKGSNKHLQRGFYLWKS